MSTQHTPEPWAWQESRVYLETFGGFDLRGCPNPEANALRIVACVNACAGIPTSHLQSLAQGALASSEYDRVQHWDKIVELTQQRDELLEAKPSESVLQTIGVLLAEAMDVVVSNGANSVSMPDKYVELAVWLDAIAKARGKV